MKTYEVRRIEISFTVTQLSVGVTDRQTDRRTDGQTDRQTDIRKVFLTSKPSIIETKFGIILFVLVGARSLPYYGIVFLT